MTREPVALEAYEALATRYARLVDTKPHNAFYERPATVSLLPDVAGMRVLDAGCGPGVYSELLASRGARVTAVDVSPAMVEQARRRLGRNVEVLEANLEEPLTFAESESFDLIVSPLMLDYVADLGQVFGEFHRILRAGRCLVFSIGHPFGDFVRHDQGSYFDTRLVQERWRGFGGEVTVPFFRRPLQAVTDPLFQADFSMDRLLEPVPTDEFRQAEPAEYERIKKEPCFMVIRARKALEALSRRSS